MNMWRWPMILMYYVIHFKTNQCQKFPLESPRHSHTRNVSQNICSKVESDLLFTHLPGKGFRGLEEMSDLVKRRFIMAGNRLKSEARRDEFHDDPNLIQALMSKAFIDNANLAFHKSDIKDDDSFMSSKHVCQGSKYPKLKLDLEKTFHASQRGKRDLPKERSLNTEDSDDLDDNYNDIKSKSKAYEDSETRVHCVRAGPNEVICRHENFSFTFKLPPDLFDKKIMENLVSSVCTIIEEASPNGKGKVEISVKKRGKSSKRIKDNFDDRSDLREPKEEGEKVVNKVIRINIPIDFSAIPLGTDDDDKGLSDRSDFLKESKQNENRENSLSDKVQDQLVKDAKLQLTKTEDSHGSSIDKEIDTQAFSRVNSLTDDVRDEDQDKWLAKRDSVQNPMVFPPSLILFKRSPNKITEQPTAEDKKIFNSTHCSNKPQFLP